MISGYHLPVAEHYEKFPYPSYPFFSLGSWKALEAVDCSKWGAAIPIRDIWIAGCGTIAPLMFARRNFGANIIASDLSSRSLFILSRRLKLFGMRNVGLKCEDLFDTKYENAFDAVDAYGVIHHTISPQKSFENLVRSLRLGGVIRVMVYSEQVRIQIEELRRRAREKDLKNIEDVKSFLLNEKLDLNGDLSHTSGIADAILNPMVHVFSRESFEKLISSVLSIKTIRLEDRGNFIFFGQKI
ncbi:MAG: Methyltransferase type 12 [Bacteriovoracaceae bacterium]|nr:Methyltransferase type 12 [Bacteriovoracaceae bacterium]